MIHFTNFESEAYPPTDTITISKAEYDALVADAMRWRKGVEDKEFGVYHNGEYIHFSRRDGQMIVGKTHDELMDKTIAYDQALDSAKGK